MPLAGRVGAELGFGRFTRGSVFVPPAADVLQWNKRTNKHMPLKKRPPKKAGKMTTFCRIWHKLNFDLVSHEASVEWRRRVKAWETAIGCRQQMGRQRGRERRNIHEHLAKGNFQTGKA